MTSEPAFDAPTKRPYACNICGKRFSKTNLRDRHERQKHKEGDQETDMAKKIKLSQEFHQRRKEVMMKRLRQLEMKKKTLHDGHEEIDRQMANVQMLIEETNDALREENSIPNIGSDEFDPDPMPDFQNLDQRDLTMGGLLAVEYSNTQRRQHLGITQDKTIQFKFTDKARSLCTTQRRAKTLLWAVLSFVTQHIPDYKTPCFVQTSIGSADSTLDFEICSTLQDNKTYSNEDIFERLDRKFCSDATFGINSAFIINILLVDKLAVGARVKKKKKNCFRKLSDYFEYTKSVWPYSKIMVPQDRVKDPGARKGKKTIWEPMTSEENPVCFLRCVAVNTLIFEDGRQRRLYKNMQWFRHPDRSARLAHRVEEIKNGSGLRDHVGFLGFPEWEAVQCYLYNKYNIQLFVLDRDQQDCVLYQGGFPRAPHSQCILALSGTHVRLILNKRYT